MPAQKVQALAWRAAVESVVAPLVRSLRDEGMPALDIAALFNTIVRNETGKRSGKERQRSVPIPPLPYADACRLISRWRSDPAFTSHGEPRPLVLTGPGSFGALARSAQVDAAHARQALQRLGLVRMRNGRLRLLADSYVPERGVAEKLDILGRDGAEFLRTMLHNVAATPGRAFLQRKTSYDNVGSASVRALLGHLRARGMDALMAADGMIAATDRDRTPSARGGRRMRVSFGVYCFSEPVAPTAKSSGRTSRRRRA